MDWTTISIALLSGSLPTIGLIVSQYMVNKNKLSEQELSLKYTLRIDEIKLNRNAYQLFISSAKDVLSGLEDCNFKYKDLNNDSIYIKLDGMTYQNVTEFFTKTIVEKITTYDSLVRDNLLSTSIGSRVPLHDITESIDKIRQETYNWANMKFDKTYYPKNHDKLFDDLRKKINTYIIYVSTEIENYTK